MITQVMDRWGNTETIHFDLEDESARETIENCGHIFGRWWDDEIFLAFFFFAVASFM